MLTQTTLPELSRRPSWFAGNTRYCRAGQWLLMGEDAVSGKRSWEVIPMADWSETMATEVTAAAHLIDNLDYTLQVRGGGCSARRGTARGVPTASVVRGGSIPAAGVHAGRVHSRGLP